MNDADPSRHVYYWVEETARAEVMKEKTILFLLHPQKHRSGGVIKMIDYIDLSDQIDGFRPVVCFHPQESDNVYQKYIPGEFIVDDLHDIHPDIYFTTLSMIPFLKETGIWDPTTPLLRLIQGFAPLGVDHPFFHKQKDAINICVSQPLADRLKSFFPDAVVEVIPNGIDVGQVPGKEKSLDILIVGNKNRTMAREAYELLRDEVGSVVLLDRALDRNTFLTQLALARIAVFFPRQTEGWYLPASEAMALNTFVVCPDVEGNRHYLRHNINGLMPPYQLSTIVDATLHAVHMQPSRMESMLSEAKRTAERFSLENQKMLFSRILGTCPRMWGRISG